MGVTSEEDLGDGMKNDDKILHCCLALDAGPPAHTEGGMKTVSRTSVLLTDDRYRTVPIGRCGGPNGGAPD
jgi:hypothetical protein